MNIQRFELILQNLKTRHREVRESEAQTRASMTAIEEKRKELKFLLRILEEYEKTSNLMASIDPNETLQEEIASTLNAALAVMEICRKAYALEGEYLARQNGVDVPTLVAQLEEGQKKQDELEGLIH